MENYFLLENYDTSEGAVSHNVLYHQPLPITRHQERFYANNYFEQLQIVSTAFKHSQNQGVHIFSAQFSEQQQFENQYCSSFNVTCIH